MIGEKVIDRKPVTLVEVKELLTERKTEKDLSYEQDLAMKYAKKFGRLTPAQVEKMRSELREIEGLNPELLNPELVVKIIDILPVRKEILQLLVPKEIVLDEASVQKILELCTKFRK